MVCQDVPVYVVQPDLVRVVHRPATVLREAVAIDVHHVDVAGPQGDAVVEQLGADVDERVQASLQDFTLVEFLAFEAELGAGLGDDLGDRGIRLSLAAALGVGVEAGVRLLPEAAEFA